MPRAATAHIKPTAASSLRMISDGSDRMERQSLDISKTTYVSLIKSPKDAYIAFAEKGKSNAQMQWLKVLHQSILGGCYVGFGGLLALSVAGNMAGTFFSNPGLVKMTFAALFPVNLLLIVMTGGQLFTGNSATCAAAKAEGMITWREMWTNLFFSLAGNVIGCALFAATANYVGLLKGGTGALATSTAVAKCSMPFIPTLVKGILCNWMVSLAVFMAGASNDLAGKLVGCWFPISTFVGIGLEHSIANLFILPCALLLGAPVTLGATITKNLIPVILGNFIAGSVIVAGSYSYQFGALGRRSREKFRQYLKERRILQDGLANGVVNGVNGDTIAPVKAINVSAAETKEVSKVFE
ncbi:formate/nitrite transporter family protein [Nitzschia inconspicua]|uniref:Formate/nitrite transporter family protein n=1 Tax=Nitzschia inconspicua TaxID=303405 RepID=A0A9K3KFP0_9STRA|nr:formate/nitrite transporter family protein [Nitzschia inconspicua]